MTFHPAVSAGFSATALCADMDWCCSWSTNDAQVFAHGSCSISSNTVAVCSTARRKRNHDVSGTRRALSKDMSPRSSTTMPKPPLCNSRSVTFRHLIEPAKRLALWTNVARETVRLKLLALATANPQQPIERNARCLRRCGIEAVARIHQRTGFLTARCGSQRRHHYASTPAGNRPGNLA